MGVKELNRGEGKWEGDVFENEKGMVGAGGGGRL